MVVSSSGGPEGGPNGGPSGGRHKASYLRHLMKSREGTEKGSTGLGKEKSEDGGPDGGPLGGKDNSTKLAKKKKSSEGTKAESNTGYKGGDVPPFDVDEDDPDYYSKRVDYFQGLLNNLKQWREKILEDGGDEGDGGELIVDVEAEDEDESENEDDDLSSSSEGEDEDEDEDESENEEGDESEDEEEEEDEGSEDEDSEDEEFSLHETLVDEGDDGSDYEGDSEDELGQEGGNGPLTEFRGRGNACGPDWRDFFMVGSSYANKRELVADLDKYAINAGVDLHLKKSEPLRVKAVCQEGCPFQLYASKDGQNPGLVVKTLNLEHNCSRVYKNRRATVIWLAAYFKKKVQDRPQYKSADMKKDVEEDLKLHVSIYKCKRAKKLIMQDMEGSYVDEFNKLEAYCHELRSSNPGSDISVEISKDALEEGRRVFSRVYVCFNAAKVGWKAGCRPIIGLDGTFLKGKARGVMLTATGLDANDSLYPIAFAVTQKENTVNWKWFLQWLNISLNLEDGGRVTLMSDMQKGLLAAVNEVFPKAEHRLCARHIYANWSKRWRGKALKKRFFACAWSTFVEQFKERLKAVGEVNKEAAEMALTYPAQCWVRAYFSTRCLSMMVDNNLSESFNAWIDDFRYLPIIRMIDGIRVKMMNKWAKSEKNVAKWRGNFSPKCISTYEANKELHVNCRVQFNGDDGYEVTEGEDRHTVWIHRKQCTCRAWELTGIPCEHAICALLHAKIDPVSQISKYYHKDTYISSYRNKLQPVRGKGFWPIDKYAPMEPPPICKLPGRPHVKRKRTEETCRRKKKAKEAQLENRNADLPPPPSEKLSKRGSIGRCTICHKEGHNRATCKDASKSTQTTPSEQAGTSAQQSQNKKPKGGRAFYRSLPLHGMGVTINEHTGRTVYNPGMASRVVLHEGSAEEYMHHNEDPETRFPLPNERTIRTTRSMTSSSQGHGTRVVQYQGDGATVGTPRDLPFTPPGLMWRGQPAMTSSQLLAQRDEMIASTSKKKTNARRGRG